MSVSYTNWRKMLDDGFDWSQVPSVNLLALIDSGYNDVFDWQEEKAEAFKRFYVLARLELTKRPPLRNKIQAKTGRKSKLKMKGFI